MARDIRGTPWKFDATGQGEGIANNGSWLRLGTFTAAATDIVTMADHGLSTGAKIRVEEGNSDLPAGLAEDTDYYVGRIDANTFYLYTTYAAALAGGTAVDITDAGTTPNYILQLPIIEHKIYVKNIAIIGDETNDGTVEVTTKSGGRILARAEIFSSANAVFANFITPVYDYVDGLYINTLDAANAIVLVYVGK